MAGAVALAAIKNRLCGSCSRFGAATQNIPTTWYRVFVVQGPVRAPIRDSYNVHLWSGRHFLPILLFLIVWFVWCWVCTSATTQQPAALHPADYRCYCHVFVCVCLPGKLYRCYKTASVPTQCICCCFFTQVLLKWLIASIADANSHTSWWSGGFSPLISMHSVFFFFFLPPNRINI